MSLYEAETSLAEVPKGLSDLGPKWKKAEVTGYHSNNMLHFSIVPSYLLSQAL